MLGNMHKPSRCKARQRESCHQAALQEVPQFHIPPSTRSSFRIKDADDGSIKRLKGVDKA
jgi:hypothetical protein